MSSTGIQEAEPQVYSTDELCAVLDRISFKNTVLDFKWQFEVVQERLGKYDEGIWLVNVSFERPDTLTGVVGRGRGRQEIIREGSTVSSVVKTAWLLVELMVRHELMEGFRFDNARIFNPHNSVFDLAKVQHAHDEKLAEQESVKCVKRKKPSFDEYIEMIRSGKMDKSEFNFCYTIDFDHFGKMSETCAYLMGEGAEQCYAHKVFPSFVNIRELYESLGVTRILQI